MKRYKVFAIFPDHPRKEASFEDGYPNEAIANLKAKIENQQNTCNDTGSTNEDSLRGAFHRIGKGILKTVFHKTHLFTIKLVKSFYHGHFPIAIETPAVPSGSFVNS